MISGATALGRALFFNAKTSGQTNYKKDDLLNLMPPKTGANTVAFLISERLTVIDALGPWEVFQDVSIEGKGFNTFELCNKLHG